MSSRHVDRATLAPTRVARRARRRVQNMSCRASARPAVRTRRCKYDVRAALDIVGVPGEASSEHLQSAYPVAATGHAALQSQDVWLRSMECMRVGWRLFESTVLRHSAQSSGDQRTSPPARAGVLLNCSDGPVDGRVPSRAGGSTLKFQRRARQPAGRRPSTIRNDGRAKVPGQPRSTRLAHPGANLLFRPLRTGSLTSDNYEIVSEVAFRVRSGKSLGPIRPSGAVGPGSIEPPWDRDLGLFPF